MEEMYKCMFEKYKNSDNTIHLADAILDELEKYMNMLDHNGYIDYLLLEVSLCVENDGIWLHPAISNVRPQKLQFRTVYIKELPDDNNCYAMSDVLNEVLQQRAGLKFQGVSVTSKEEMVPAGERDNSPKRYCYVMNYKYPNPDYQGVNQW